ncbi:MAG: hypothetical protein K0R78_2286 [Pelosinus sp.]|jgi:hypothetical protein|nr:hypothetical protein [Pelosinus sp.]
MNIRSKDMPQRKIIVMISGMEAAEQEKLAKIIRETIRKENHLKTEKISYQISY